MKKITAVLIGAGQRGKDAYAKYALEYPDEIEFIAVADPDKERLEMFKQTHYIKDENCFSDWQTLFAQDKLADVALICTQDDMHYEPTMSALEKGYHLLLEKPMSNNLDECIAIGEMSKKYNKKITVCHVLRYTEFFRKLKSILDQKVIGDIVTIQHEENVGYWHQAHSFVRGNWRNSKESSPMILAKSCHDMDILLWLVGSNCKSLTSFGDLKYFKKENAPEGAPLRCSDGCPVEASCPYSAGKIYIDWSDGWQASILKAVVSNDTSDEGIKKALKEGPYGRCVYHCDNDVVDHQVVNMEFDNGVTAVFTMTGFTVHGDRVIKIFGTKGQIIGSMENAFIEVEKFGDKNIKRYPISSTSEGHGGGDFGIMSDLVQSIQPGADETLSSAEISVQSHVMAFAAEESRLNNGRSIQIKDYWNLFK